MRRQVRQRSTLGNEAAMPYAVLTETTEDGSDDWTPQPVVVPERVHCGDGHFRRVIFGLGPYIADYPEQVCLAGIVSGWCPKYAWCA